MRAFLHLSPAYRPPLPIEAQCNTRRIEGLSVCSRRRRRHFWVSFAGWSLLYGAGVLTGWLLAPLLPSLY